MMALHFLHHLVPTKYLLRALGFELLNTLLRRWAGGESCKPVLRRSRWIALSRCAIHMFPCTVFLFLIPLNFSAKYIGPGFSYRTSNGTYLVLFQIGAKLLEIVCVASLTTVVLHVLRHDLMRDGVPLGFVGSGMFFSQANCFWSPEMFRGVLFSARSWKRLRFLILITVAGALALLIAPSSAILLQPRSQTVPAGGTAYYLPVSPDQLWPSVIDGSDELKECFGEYIPQNIVCASAGFESLRSYFQNFNTSFDLSSMLWDTYNIQPTVVSSLTGIIPRLLNTGTIAGLARETFVFQPNAMTAIFQDALMGDWRDAIKSWSGSRFSSESQYKYATQRLSSVVTTSPVVYLRCTSAQNLSTGQSQMMFPVKTWTGNPSWEEDDDGKVYNVTVQSWKASSNLQHEWIDLPTDRFGPVSGGIAVRLPGSVQNSSQAIIGCSISAFWFSGEVTSDSLANEAAWSFTESHNQWAPIRTDLNAASPIAKNHRRLITIRPEWFKSLTPLTSCVSHNNQTQHLSTLSCLLFDVGFSTVFSDMRAQGRFEWDGQSCPYRSSNLSETDIDRYNHGDCGNGSKHQLFEMILGSFLANGLSRHGSRYAFSTSSILASPGNPFKWTFNSPSLAPNYNTSILKNDPHHSAVLRAPTDSPCVDLRMHIHVAGYAWYASSFSEYLAIAVALTYMLVALAHTVWVLATGVTSSSWDTVTELLALALESPVPNALRGSGAGIERLGTYKRMVRLRARNDEAGSGDERVILVVDGEEVASRQVRYRTDKQEGEETQPRARYSRVEVEKTYL